MTNTQTNTAKKPFSVLLNEVRQANKYMGKFIKANDMPKAEMWAKKVTELEKEIENY